jgi:DNA polymerase I-like protein with 3'-5' exonuclease and polymerase domains
MSTWTWQPFHKDEGIYMPNSDEQDRQLWAYNGKDVYGMRLVYKAIMEYAKTIPGLEGSIQHAMKAIKPYLTMTFFGIPFDDDIRGKIQERDDRLMTQYLRCMQILTGPSVSPLISNQKCVRYFHDMMDYQVIRRSKITGKPSLNEYAIQKLRLKHRDNPVLELLLAYRALQKENSSLGFNIWK